MNLADFIKTCQYLILFLELGALRAGNAAHVMIKDGIEPQRIKTISYGKENPQYPGTGEEIWAKNRNVTTNVKNVEEKK